jgi:hypothetical protein
MAIKDSTHLNERVTRNLMTTQSTGQKSALLCQATHQVSLMGTYHEQCQLTGT